VSPSPGLADDVESLHQQSDSLLEFCGNLEGDVKELRRRVHRLERVLMAFGLDITVLCQG
jgi:hypothetical protein